MTDKEIYKVDKIRGLKMMTLKEAFANQISELNDGKLLFAILVQYDTPADGFDKSATCSLITFTEDKLDAIENDYTVIGLHPRTSPTDMIIPRLVYTKTIDTNSGSV